MDREDKAVAGIGDEFQHDFSCNDYSTANHIDMDKFKATVLLSDLEYPQFLTPKNNERPCFIG